MPDAASPTTAATTTAPLDLTVDAAVLTAQLVDIESVSGDEKLITDLVEAALRDCGALAGRIAVERDGNVVIARTELGRPQRVVLAGHLDTVPIAENLPSQLRDGRLYGCGATDMKSGVAVQLRIAQLVGAGELEPTSDLTWVFYDCEEVDASRNGLGRIARERPQALSGDLAVLLEGTNGVVEGGCQGTLRARITLAGQRAHSARSWLGVNAIQAAAPVLARLDAYQARVVDVEGLTYREGLNAVFITGGIAGNVIPDECTITVNYRFAPDLTEAQAAAHVRDLFADYPVEIIDSAPAARPGLDAPVAQRLVTSVGGEPAAKLGWTDVARFGELGIAAVNFGPGDPNVAHTRDEYVTVSNILAAEVALVAFLSD
ncbi:succinyldiaminopimelate desuccinylase [Jatrophihabitans sp. GAS493]|uniref:succinyl-diaminopimelate desuccinylase n=1 Tax=Jatrophihabitans sp. GAS493 TaxID=1907575 RepID=UPI000BB77FD8|nr:succinyl-diaminopimelate desuccinylase [Jatrophihabitans sp. GAS493]SOD75112.1 succinyldiaminopimelate desuccinylase [Jatrophihabitans sp. GAS493]